MKKIRKKAKKSRTYLWQIKIRSEYVIKLQDLTNSPVISSRYSNKAVKICKRLAPSEKSDSVCFKSSF